MKRGASFFFFAFLLTAAVGRANTESIGGRLQKGPAGEVVLTLDLASARLTSLADKEGKEAEFGVPALAELIRERFHYLMRWRVAGENFAPTSVALALPRGDAPLPDFLPLTVIWAGSGLAGGRVVTQSDSPDYTLMLTVVDERAASTPQTGGAVPALESWSRAWFRAARVGFTGILPGGIGQILFVLALYFSVRTARDLGWQVAAFTAAHSMTLWFATNGVIRLTGDRALWVDLGVALSIAIVAWRNFLSVRAPGRAWFALMGAFGLLHGLGLARALGEARQPEGWTFSELLAANLGIELGQIVVVGAAVLMTGVWRQRAWYRPSYRPGIALPASMVLSLGGLIWAWESVQTLLKISR